MKYKNVIWKKTMKEEHISIYRTMLRRNNAWIRNWDPLNLPDLEKCYKLFVQTLLKTCLNGLLKKKMDCLLLFRPFLEWQEWVLSILESIFLVLTQRWKVSNTEFRTIHLSLSVLPSLFLIIWFQIGDTHLDVCRLHKFEDKFYYSYINSTIWINIPKRSPHVRLTDWDKKDKIL